MTDKQKCCGRVYKPGRSFGNRFGDCTKAGKIERDGKFYCSMHDPVTRQEKRDRKSEELRVKWAAQKLARDHREWELKAVAILRELLRLNTPAAMIRAREYLYSEPKAPAND